jgi:Amt family ammonium transporter
MYFLYTVLGIFSATSLGVFSGFGFAEGLTSITEQVSVQLVGIISTLAYTALMTYLLLKLVGILTQGLRVSEEHEMSGLDQVDHEESGYNL